jgi:CPA2 family monovalent cation:H+ antiporter-2
MAVGPHALGWVPESGERRQLAEFGIVFLMFSIGLEFSLPQLRAMRRAVFGLGAAQVAITTIAGMIVVQMLGYDWRAGIVLGGALAMSSTAIVSKLLAERSELGTPHGRDVMGILLFQDLAVVAFLILIPSLAGSGQAMGSALAVALLKAAVALAIILFLGQRPMRAWFHVVARQRSPELFVLNVLLVTLGMAALTAMAGLSLALGAFLAGMLISETEYRYQVEEDIKPFRDVLLGLFFITIGMMLDLRDAQVHTVELIALLVVPVAAKLGLVAALARLFGSPLPTALRTGSTLRRPGVRAGDAVARADASAARTGVHADGARVDDPVDAARAAADPVREHVGAQADGERLARPCRRNDAGRRADDGTAGSRDRLRLRAQRPEPHATARARGHHAGARPDPQRVREAADGTSVIYGDASRRETLVSAGIAKARRRHHVRGHVDGAEDPPSCPAAVARICIVRTRDDSELDRLFAAGRPK